jgi:hypothetical protein
VSHFTARRAQETVKKIAKSTQGKAELNRQELAEQEPNEEDDDFDEEVDGDEEDAHSSDGSYVFEEEEDDRADTFKETDPTQIRKIYIADTDRNAPFQFANNRIRTTRYRW